MKNKEIIGKDHDFSKPPAADAPKKKVENIKHVQVAAATAQQPPKLNEHDKGTLRNDHKS